MNKYINFFDLSPLQRDALLYFGWVAKNGSPLKKGVKFDFELTPTEIKANLMLKMSVVEELNKLMQQSPDMV